MTLEPLLQEAKRQLHEEADYLREAGHLQRFAMLLEDAPEFLVPGVDEDLTRDNILAMDLLVGEPIESLTSATQTTRDRVVGLLLGLLFRKLGGLYLLAARLRARVDVRAILEPHLTREVKKATA